MIGPNQKQRKLSRKKTVCLSPDESLNKCAPEDAFGGKKRPKLTNMRGM